MSIDAGFDRATEIATADVTVERGGRTGRFQLRERYFGRDDIADALLAAGFAVEEEATGPPSRSAASGRLVGRPPRLMTPFSYKSTHNCR